MPLKVAKYIVPRDAAKRIFDSRVVKLVQWSTWNHVHVSHQNLGLTSVDIYLHHDVTTRSRLDGASICDSYGQIACVLVLQCKSGTSYVMTSA